MKKYIVILFFVVSLFLQYSCSTSNDYEDMDYQKACENLDFVTAQKIIGERYRLVMNKINEYDINSDYEYFKLNSFVEALNKYFNTDEYVFKKEILFLLESDIKDKEDKLIYALLDTQFFGDKPRKGKNEYTHSEFREEDIGYYGCCNFRLYNMSVQHFNKKCDILLEVAIIKNNKNLAKRVLEFYKEKAICKKGSSNVSFTSEDKKNAQNLFNEKFN